MQTIRHNPDKLVIEWRPMGDTLGSLCCALLVTWGMLDSGPELYAENPSIFLGGLIVTGLAYVQLYSVGQVILIEFDRRSEVIWITRWTMCGTRHQEIPLSQVKGVHLSPIPYKMKFVLLKLREGSGFRGNQARVTPILSNWTRLPEAVNAMSEWLIAARERA